ncbi:MAG: EamA family transporter [Faecousia sp.]
MLHDRDTRFFLEEENNLLIFTPAEFLICFVSGGAMAALVVSWALAIKTDAYMLVTACASGSFIIPCIFGLFILNEQFTLFKFVSFVAIIAALFFLLRYNLSVKGKLGKMQIFLLALVLLSQGLNQTMQKLYVHYITYKGASAYTLYSFFFATIILFLVAIPLKAPRDTQQHHHHLIRGNMKYVVLMSLGLFGASYFQTLAAASVEAFILYPLTNALSLIAGSLMASLFFQERINKDSVLGVIFVLAALIFSRL